MVFSIYPIDVTNKICVAKAETSYSDLNILDVDLLDFNIEKVCLYM